MLAATVALAATLLVGVSTASAQSEVNGNFNLKFGPYFPRIDEEFSGGETPFQDSFGDDNRVLGQVDVEYYLWQGHGKFAVGATAGYTNFTGKSDIRTGGGNSSDGSSGSDSGSDNANGSNGEDGLNLSEETKFQLLPVGLTVSYRWDYLAQHIGVPLAPKVEGGFDYYMWRVVDGSGKVARAGEDNTRALGAVPGYHLSGRIEVLLDYIDPSTAAAFDVNWGINNTYLFAEYTLSRINRFGGDAFMLGDSTWKLGLAFEF